MPKINQEEYEVLKEALSDGYEWIVRDSHNPLCVHRHKPVKQDHWIQQYWGNAGNGYKEIDDKFFQFIQWSNSEPYNIAELIEEYESEETEVKNIEWVKKEIENMPYTRFKREGMEDYILISKSDVLEYLDQLDESEVLSLELPVIPNYVAKWISEHHEKFDLYPALRRLEEGSTRDYDAYKWYRKNTRKFVNAYLTGKYEVEEQPQYRLKAGENYLYFNLDGTVRGATKDNATITNERLEQLPFDVEKAVESRIIEIEEVKEC